MTEPLDPAPDVASKLKSLKTRMGLREERLRGTEVILDSFTRLDSVRVMINAGQSLEWAIVRAVRAAANMLEPTMKIVADASLGLELFAGQVPDTDLYAQDLGQRREALLRNWDRLHELQSAPPDQAPSLRSLRLEVEDRALRALAAALSTSARTDASASAPAGVNELWAREPRSDDAKESPAASTLLQTFQNVARALRDSLTRDAEGMPIGWRQDLRDLPDEATAVSTAYGIRAMLLLEDGLAADLIPVAEGLRKMALPGGGYASSGQTGPRAESTAAVLNALRRINPTEDFDAYINRMERDLGDFEKARPFILTTMLETSMLLGPESSLVGVLVDSLLATRRRYGRHLLWPARSESSLVDPFPSVAHTARAVRVLADVQAIRPAIHVQEALDQGVAWLIEQSDLRNTDETIERVHGDGIESVPTWHFTAAWVAKALVSAGVPAAHRTVSNAADGIWRSYSGDPVGLWHSDIGELPIWMTFDAIEALRLASLASTPGSAGPPPVGARVTELPGPTTMVR